MQESILSTKPSLLIVDDDPTVIQVLVEYLESTFLLSVAKSRAKAMELLGSKAFDLVLLDVNLPDGNGIDICKEIKGTRDYSDSLVVIFMTGHHSSEMEALGLSAGANDYIYKPVNKEVLLARINLQLNLLRKTKLLAHLAKVDGLTEIGNRRAFDEQITQEWYRAKREAKPLSLILLDIDFFKQFNDTYGHPEGDNCLRSIAQCLTESFKRHSDFCFRFGGEEFAVVLFDTDIRQASDLVNIMLQNLTNLEIPNEKSTVCQFVTVSVGICDSFSGCDSAKELLDKADKYLYQAKHQGRNQVRYPTDVSA